MLFELAVFLKKFPALKRLVKTVYQRSMWLIYKPSENVQTEYAVNTVDIGERETFFGYYDKSPESPNGHVLVCSTSSQTMTLPETIDSIQVSVVDRQSGEVLSEVSTSAFNWQQGARAHWIDDDEFFYNDYDDKLGQYVSRTFSVKANAVVRQFSMPVQDSFDRQYFLALNYVRLAEYNPDYGYFRHERPGREVLQKLDDDGVFYVDFESGDTRLLLSIEQLLQDPDGIPADVDAHSINHIMISPDGDRFIFLHRMFSNDVRHDRLCCFDLRTGTHSVICVSSLISHSCWLDSSTVVTYMKNGKSGIGYWKLDLDSGTRTLLEPLTDTGFGDGHPSVNGNSLLTDSYPDKSRMQHVIAYDLENDKPTILGSFLQSFAYSGQTRCDLHPRYSPKGERVYFDSVHSGKRKLCFIELT